MITGSCLCGGIRFEYDAEIHEIALCHCLQCRKAQGGAFAVNSPVDSTKLRFISGTELIKEFQSNPNKVRAFCSQCGSPIYSARNDLPNVKRLRVGTIETPFQCENKYHIYADSTPDWDTIKDSYPRFSENKM